MNEEMIQLVVAWLRKWKDEPSVSIDFQLGRDEQEPVDGNKTWKPNGTASLVISINGGAQVNELAEDTCSHPKEYVLDLSTFEGPKYLCRACNAESETPFLSTED